MNFKTVFSTVTLIFAVPSMAMSASLRQDPVNCFFDCNSAETDAVTLPQGDQDTLFLDQSPSLFGSETQYWGDLSPQSAPTSKTQQFESPFGKPDTAPSER